MTGIHNLEAGVLEAASIFGYEFAWPSDMVNPRPD